MMKQQRILFPGGSRNRKGMVITTQPHLLVPLVFFATLLWLLLILMIFPTFRRDLTTTESTNDNKAIQQQAVVESRPYDVELVLENGLVVRMELRKEACPEASRVVMSLIDAGAGHNTANHACKKCNLYRAEPVPDFWASPEMPDSWFGGRWGPPYALVQGSFGDGEERGQGKAPREKSKDSRPEITRGDVAWAGGRGGNEFFIALADHPEWKNGHTVFGKVAFLEDVAALEKLVNDSPRIIIPGKPEVQNFEKKVRFQVRAPSYSNIGMTKESR